MISITSSFLSYVKAIHVVSGVAPDRTRKVWFFFAMGIIWFPYKNLCLPWRQPIAKVSGGQLPVGWNNLLGTTLFHL